MPRARKKSPFPRPSVRPPTILAVEDEVLIRSALADYLTDCGFRVVEAPDAGRAIEILKSWDDAIDLVFSNVNMPGDIDGFGLARWVHRNRPGISVLLTAGDARKANAARDLCEEEPFLLKPYDLAAVASHLRAMIKERCEQV